MLLSASRTLLELAGFAASCSITLSSGVSGVMEAKAGTDLFAQIRFGATSCGVAISSSFDGGRVGVTLDSEECSTMGEALPAASRGAPVC